MGGGRGLRTENLTGLACVWTDSTQAIYRKSLYRKFPETFTQWLTSIRFSYRELYKSRLFRSQGQMLDHLHSHCGGTSYMCHTPKSIGQPSEVVHFLFFKRTLFAQFFATVGLQIRLRSWTTLAGAIGLEMIISADPMKTSRWLALLRCRNAHALFMRACALAMKNLTFVLSGLMIWWVH